VQKLFEVHVKQFGKVFVQLVHAFDSLKVPAGHAQLKLLTMNGLWHSLHPKASQAVHGSVQAILKTQVFVASNAIPAAHVIQLAAVLHNKQSTWQLMQDPFKYWPDGQHVVHSSHVYNPMKGFGVVDGLYPAGHDVKQVVRAWSTKAP
jgi:hypothetical protein